MGREATCQCRWGKRSGTVNVHLDGGELTVRGEIRAQVARGDLTDARVRGTDLLFAAAGESVELLLGPGEAARWLRAIVAPVPNLAQKFGIAAETRVAVIGAVDDEALRDAIAAGTTVALTAQPEIAIVRSDDALFVERAAAKLSARTSPPAVWVVYEKGRHAPLGETAVRDILRAHGFRDTKVAAVSPRLTALRFSTVAESASRARPTATRRA
jgi:hypothetical protein